MVTYTVNVNGTVADVITVTVTDTITIAVTVTVTYTVTDTVTGTVTVNTTPHCLSPATMATPLLSTPMPPHLHKKAGR